MFKRQKFWLWVVGALILFLLALNFLSFRVAGSNSEMNHQLSTYRTGDSLPDNMVSADFALVYAINGEEQLAAELATALQAEFESHTSVSTATAVSATAQIDNAPFLLVDLTTDRLWTPFYGNATVTARLFYAYDGEAPWPLDEPVAFQDSPAVKADGEFTLVDTTWGLISKPAYNEHLAQALAEAIATALQNDVFSHSPDNT